MSQMNIILIPLLPLLGFFLNGTVALLQSRGGASRVNKSVAIVACLMPFLSFLLALQAFFALKSGLSSLDASKLLPWMLLDQFTLHFGYTIDPLSSVMILIVTGVGFLIHLYSTGYMHDDPAFARYMSYINLFLFFMLTLVMADSLVLLFVGWEGVGLCSYLLIGFWFSDPEKAKAGKKAFVVNRIGDFAFLIGMFFIVALFSSQAGDGQNATATNYLDFSFLRDPKNVSFLGSLKLLSLPAASVIGLCLFAGATGKSAQIPLYVWLPDAMAGPTPVSALIHAATMVTAGIYLIARMSFLINPVLAPEAMQVITVIGVATALMAALIAVTQYDIKKVLAYSTVSQLGYMVMALGVAGYSAAIFHVMTHAFFKACLFLGAGSVIHALHHEQDVRQMGGLLRRMPITGATFLISTLAIAGVPPLSGFFSKDEILFLVHENAFHPAIYWVALFTAGLTAFYMMRLFVYAFLGKTRYKHPDHIHESPLTMTIPLIILAGLAAVAGYIGLPAVLGHNQLGEWLHFLGQKTPPHNEVTEALEIRLMILSAGWGGFCLLLSWYVFSRAHHLTLSVKSTFRLFHEFAANKFKIDELYNAAIVRPIKALSDVVLYKFVDVKIIDGFMVHGFVNVSRFVSRSLSSLHTGIIAHYLFYFLLGLCFILGFLVWM